MQQTLRESIGDDAFIDLLGLYLADTVSQIGALIDAYQRGDQSTVWHCAHNLKSSSGAVGARELKELCGRLEAQSSEGNMPDRTLIDMVESVYKDTKHALQAVIVAARQDSP